MKIGRRLEDNNLINMLFAVMLIASVIMLQMESRVYTDALARAKDIVKTELNENPKCQALNLFYANNVQGTVYISNKLQV